MIYIKLKEEVSQLEILISLIIEEIGNFNENKKLENANKKRMVINFFYSIGFKKTSIGLALKNDHSSVIHAIKRNEDLSFSDKSYKKKNEEFQDYLFSFFTEKGYSFTKTKTIKVCQNDHDSMAKIADSIVPVYGSYKSPVKKELRRFLMAYFSSKKINMTQIAYFFGLKSHSSISLHIDSHVWFKSHDQKYKKRYEVFLNIVEMNNAKKYAEFGGVKFEKIIIKINGEPKLVYLPIE